MSGDARAGVIARLAAEIGARDPVDTREADSIVEVLAGLAALARPLDENADPMHVTGSALIIGTRGIILLKHKRLGIWVQPGGHVDPGEDPAQAALREAVEETGLPVSHRTAEGLDARPTLFHVDAHDGGRGHRHLDLRYLLHAPPEDPIPPPEESQHCRWVGWEEAATMADAGLSGVFPRLQNVPI